MICDKQMCQVLNSLLPAWVSLVVLFVFLLEFSTATLRACVFCYKWKSWMNGGGDPLSRCNSRPIASQEGWWQVGDHDLWNWR